MANKRTEEELPPRPAFPIPDFPAPTQPEPYYASYETGIPIAIDLGRSTTRIGLAKETSPNNVFPTVMSRFKDRRVNRMITLVGNDMYLDNVSKSNIRSAFDGPMINNWDVIEKVLDYGFLHCGVSSQGRVDNPIVMNEVLAPPLQQRTNMMELLFEAYNVPKLAFGADCLFSYYQNGGSTGLVIGTGHDATHLIPVVEHKPVLSIAKRLDWGGRQATNYLMDFIGLKYPYFPTRLTTFQMEKIKQDYCYVSKNFSEEITHYLDLDNLEKNDIVLEVPFTEVVKHQKTEEELQLEAERKREQIKRLHEQARERRLEKLVQKEADFSYFTGLKERMKSMNKREQIDVLRNEGFQDEAEMNRHIANLEKSLKKARNEDIGENTSEEPPSFPLLEVPDEQLSDEQMKEKRKQRLMKANYDARMRAKQEKELAKKEAEEAAEKDRKWRESDLSGWIADRRERLEKLIQRVKERKRLKEELTDRKSRAAQNRMKNIASLADEDRGAGRRKKAGNVTIDNDPNDTFGANDEDWAVYRAIAREEDDDAEEEVQQEILKIEEELLEHDPNFTVEDTLQRQFDWRNSLIHRFLRGPRSFDPEDQHQQHQIHLNVERIRIPEILFQPSIAGVDQAGIVELAEDTLLRRLPGEKGFSGDDATQMMKDVFITGGQSLFQNFQERLDSDLRAVLPVGSPLRVRLAQDPLLDAWRGMAKWSLTDEAKHSYVSRQEYAEYGAEYIKENNMGCVRL
ncbi:hypothetical protein KL930_005102 [Ogataea haglerorum]|uniref:Actin-related protein 5 n=1 Tax=Ogataea haglerorum TaxID=1937702 RepID=A0ABQ7R9G9_9ASCO|nr:hypothetical protein KL914_005060 [Ogataea haglerorum]KAG7734138.1 hypothetical protein KL932_005002 [Ogataea haglerorum]KAG7761856.1 hypothetical protein KL946_005082 [Ogataea haglerorum]KAG7772647.1 hypothetical protein KL930_005102 [Ogataea haglerorum]KAG7774077.1 hypothetical protein KL922_004887 [Ogataea haglerorum]